MYPKGNCEYSYMLQRAVPKAFDKQMGNLQAKVNTAHKVKPVEATVCACYLT